MKRIGSKGLPGRGFVLAIALAVGVIVACGTDPGGGGEELGSTKEQLRTNPDLSTFAVYASNSISVLDRGNIQGGDVGVQNASSGPFLVTGFEAALTADAKIDVAHDLLADQVSLRDRATVGDVEATHITVQNNGVYVHQYAFPAMPALPAPDATSPGAIAFSVSSGQTQTMTAGAYGAVTVNGTLNLSGGTYDFASLTVGNDAHLEALATSKVRIAGRVSTGDRAHIEPSGSTLTAKDLRIEIDGLNGGSGSPTATPSTFTLGNDTVTRALILAANGTVRTGQRTNATGALLGRDVLVNLDAKVFYEDGFPSCSADGGTCSSNDAGTDSSSGGTDSGGTGGGGDAGHEAGTDAGGGGGGDAGQDAGADGGGGQTCTPSSCDDGNACTTDTCSGATCTHAPIANGTACSDGNACTIGDSCIAGSCVPGSGPAIDDGNPCTVDACDPVFGVTHTAAPSGTSCSDGNACNGSETCDASGACTAGTPPTVDDGNVCTDDACDPATGVTHTPRPAGDQVCSDNDACNGVETCNGSGTCVPGAPPTMDDGNVCTVDQCSPITGPFHTPIAGCDPTPVRTDDVLETRASLVGRVADSSGAPILGASFNVYDDREAGTPRSDVSAHQANDGSFRIRLTSFPTSEPARSAIHRLILTVDAPGRITAHRITFAHPGDVQDVGSIRLISRDSTITNIGPDGGTATDSRGLYQVVIPAGALSTTIPVQVTPFDTREDFPAPLPDVTLTEYGVELEPSGTMFLKPVTLRALNTKNVPTTMKIPVGYYNEPEGRWDTTGEATWDGARFATQIQHFSKFDLNLAAIFDLIMSWSKTPAPASGNCPFCPVGSTWQGAGGSVVESFGLPSIHAGGEDFGLSLQYDSGLAGSRKLGVSPSTSTGTPQALPSGSLAVSVSGTKAKTECVAAGSNSGEATSADGCSGSSVVGICTGGVSQFVAGVGILGTDVAKLLATPTNAQEIYGDASWLEVPLATDGTPDQSSPLARTTLVSQKVSVTSKGAKTCAANGGSFGVSDPLLDRVTVQAESGAMAVLTHKVLLHHRFSSPFGAGWALGEVSRAYFDGDHAYVVDGTGREEEFRPRAHLDTTGLSGLNSNSVFALDAMTGEHFVAEPGGAISSIDPVSGAKTSVVPSGSVPAHAAHSLAVAYVGGARHFILASLDGVFDIAQAGGVRQLYARTNPAVGPFQMLYVAARGSDAFFTVGDNDANGNAARLFTVDLTQATPTAVPLSLAFGAGDISLHPSATLGGVSFGAPKGLAFATDGSLYAADSRREVVYQIRPDTSGRVTAASRVDVAVGDGVGRQANPTGEPQAAELFSLNQPTYIGMSEDGYLFIGLSYGVVSFDPQAKEAEVLFQDGNREEIVPVITTSVNPPPAFLPISKSFMLSTTGDLRVVHITTDLLSSERDPTRTITRDSSGAATLTDTTSGFVDGFDTAGRQIAHRRRTGKTLYQIAYSDSSSDRIDRITNAVGGTFAFQYSNGKLSGIIDPAGGITSFSVNDLGDLTSFTKPDGETNTFQYNAHHLTQKQSPFGDTTNLTYNDDGTLKSSLRPNGEFHQTASSLSNAPVYSAAGTLSQSGSYTDEHGVLHTIVTDDYGAVAKDSYTADGVNYVRLPVVPSPLVGISEDIIARHRNVYQRASQWTLNGVPLSAPLTFDSYGRVVQQKRAVAGGTNGSTVWTYDANGFLSSLAEDQSSTIQVFQRDSVGRVLAIVDTSRDNHAPSGRQTQFTWRADDQPATITSHNVTTTLTYDDASGTANLISTSDTLGRTTTLGYDARGNVTSTSDGTASASFVYDANNRLTKSIDGAGDATTFNYINADCGCSQDNLVTSIVTADAQEWQFEYGPLGQLKTVIDPAGFPESYEYGLAGQEAGQLVKVTDRLGRPTQFAHDQLGRLSSTLDIANRRHGMTYTVPTAGAWVGPSLNLGSPDSTTAGAALSSSLRNGEYQIGANAYDVEGYPARITAYRDPTFQLAYNQIFDDAGRLTHRIDRANQAITSATVLAPAADGTFDDHIIEYDPRTSAPLVTTVESEGASSAEPATISRNVEFDDTSEAGFGSGNALTQTFGRDVGGRLTSATHHFNTGVINDPIQFINGPTSTYTYRADGRIGQIVNADGTHNFTYDARGLVTRQDVQNGLIGETYLYGYDVQGRNTSLTFPDGHVRTQTFDGLGRITQRCYEYSTIQARCYGATYDPVGNIIELRDPEGTDTIAVDGLDRIASVTRTGTPGSESYAYNTLGALTQNASVAVDHQRPRLDGAGNADAAVPATIGGQAITLNQGGRISAMRGSTLDFSTQGYLRGVDGIRFAIGTNGQRAWTNLGAIEGYIYEGANRVGSVQHVAQKNGSNVDRVVNQWLFDGIDHPLRMIHTQPSMGAGSANPSDKTSVIYYELDLAGNVRRLRGANGEDLGGYRYTAFGRLVEDTATAPLGMLDPAIGANDQTLMWKGRPRQVLAGTEVYDMRARQWVPELGTFLSIDEYGFHDDDSTLWGWGNQNPIRFGDPTGRRPGDRYSSPTAAAIAALSDVLSYSLASGEEWGGTIYDNNDGSFSYGPPTTDHSGVQVTVPLSCPATADVVGTYHTHPNTPGKAPELVSQQDKDEGTKGFILLPFFKQYVATPHGFLGVYNPATDSTSYNRVWGNSTGGYDPFDQ